MIRPTALRAATRAVARTTTTTTAAPRSAASFSTSAKRSGGGHGPVYDPPSGWLFGVKPGEKYQNEGWENIFFYGFCGSLAVFAVAYAWKPDTS
ncbi:ESSS subunit of NADH:ubiquinone oxidoreductase [Cladorrhinum samala]|uniref:NADH dehydrogenase [ubiquinone] 1 beta subcomplex subunit 11, mitochondrial n=1 Tax=Cladorrhinum samala TaxID=585594 RepID=A0AAV9HUW4_9PEZI|nr:ESSS subunit of NADH:ubiquinone oxidoreductase [Cladorrhinum samala]